MQKLKVRKFDGLSSSRSGDIEENCRGAIMPPPPILNRVKFDQVMFNSLVFTWEKFEVTLGIFSVLVTQVNVLESYLDIYVF